MTGGDRFLFFKVLILFLNFVSYFTYTVLTIAFAWEMVGLVSGSA